MFYSIKFSFIYSTKSRCFILYCKVKPHNNTETSLGSVCLCLYICLSEDPHHLSVSVEMTCIVSAYVEKKLGHGRFEHKIVKSG